MPWWAGKSSQTLTCYPNLIAVYHTPSVRAIVPDSQAYAYYEPEVRAEAQGKEIAVGNLPQQ